MESEYGTNRFLKYMRIYQLSSKYCPSEVFVQLNTSIFPSAVTTKNSVADTVNSNSTKLKGSQPALHSSKIRAALLTVFIRNLKA